MEDKETSEARLQIKGHPMMPSEATLYFFQSHYIFVYNMYFRQLFISQKFGQIFII